jgi:hypothetical protein
MYVLPLPWRMDIPIHIPSFDISYYPFCPVGTRNRSGMYIWRRCTTLTQGLPHPSCTIKEGLHILPAGEIYSLPRCNGNACVFYSLVHFLPHAAEYHSSPRPCSALPKYRVTSIGTSAHQKFSVQYILLPQFYVAEYLSRKSKHHATRSNMSAAKAPEHRSDHRFAWWPICRSEETERSRKRREMTNAWITWITWIAGFFAVDYAVDYAVHIVWSLAARGWEEGTLYNVAFLNSE